MSAPQDDGGPVSATLIAKNGDPITPEGGLSIRDWFAGLALQAIISKAPHESVPTGVNESDLARARGAYDYADAMLKVRKGEQP